MNLTTSEIIQKWNDGEVTFSQLVTELKQAVNDSDELKEILQTLN